MAKRIYDKPAKEWAKKVKERDGFKCIVCGSTGNIKAPICSHHLIPWSVEKFRLDVNNGITLCSRHHTKYGNGLSPHSEGNALFFFWLFENKPEIYKWLKENWNNV